MEGLNDASKNAPVSLDTPIVPYVTDVTVAPLPKVEERTKCRFFTSAKGCRLGSACRFLHIAKAVVDDSKALEGSKQELNPQKDGMGKVPRSSRRKASKTNVQTPFVIEKAASLANGESSETATSSTPHIKKVFNLKMVDGKMVAVEVVEPSKVVPSKKSQDKTTEPKATTETLKPTSRSNKKRKTAKIAAPSPQKPSEPASSASEPSILISTKALSQVPPASRAPVARPAPQTPTSRFETELLALSRRFKTTLTGQPNFRKLHDTPTTSTYHFQLTPTDPDFPFDLDHLSIDLNLLTSDTLSVSHPPISGSTIRIRNADVPGHLARGVERAWERTTTAICSSNPNGSGATLLAMTNWVDRNLERLLSSVESVGSITFVKNEGVEAAPERNVEVKSASLVARDNDEKIEGDSRGFKSKVFYYGVPISEGEESSDSSVGTDFEDDDISEQGQADDVDAELEEEEDTPASSSFILNTPHRGVQLRLPDIQLTSISLLTCTSLSLQLRCIRCKTDVDVHSLTSTRRFPCIKCSTMLSVTFRPTPVHAESKDMGYVDAEGTKVVDM